MNARFLNAKFKDAKSDLKMLPSWLMFPDTQTPAFPKEENIVVDT
jgi:hypothetical protein